MGLRSTLTALAVLAVAWPGPARASYWIDQIAHVGRSSAHPDPNYQVYRNVRHFGAKGDGVTDDTAAINAAISTGGRCAPQVCSESTISPAIVYFPAGTYLLSGSIIDYFYTQLVGDPTDLPVIKAAAGFPTATTFGLLDGNRYGANGLAWKSVNVFYRQVRNLIFDTTAIPPSANAVAIHWPSSQATSISNVVFRLSAGAGTQHVGLFIEEGSGGLLSDLQFEGGYKAARLGNQQYTARNLVFSNCQVGIELLWDWGWTFKSLIMTNVGTGILMPDQHTGSITLLDSTFSAVSVAVSVAIEPAGPRPYHSVNSVVVWNTVFNRVGVIIRSPKRVIWRGNPSGTVAGVPFAIGHVYSPTGPVETVGGSAQYFTIPPALMQGNKIYERSKPVYSDLAPGSILSARTFGARGDGISDDTAALQNLFSYAAANPSKLAFVDAGTYLVKNTVQIPPGARVVGEALASLIVGVGPSFQNPASPRPVVRVASPGQTGVVELSDLIVSTRGPAPGAILIEWNLASPPAAPSGMWDVHGRVGGYSGSQLQLANCAATPGGGGQVNSACIGAYMSLHVTASASGLFVENAWFWVADHDLEDPNYSQITVYAGRGVLVESAAGPVWLSAVGSEHHALYQFQLANTRSVYMGQPQSETPYYQPSPGASRPFAPNAALNDPDFAAVDCAGAGRGMLAGAPCEMAWGLRVLGAQDVAIFGAGFYSFFNNYDVGCSDVGAPVACQSRIVDVRDGRAATSNLIMYNLDTIGSVSMVRRLGKDIALAAANSGEFSTNLVVYKH